MSGGANEREQERKRRIGRNEALFRKVNEQVEIVNEAFGGVTGDFAVVCECGDAGCIKQLRVSHAVYERVRSDPRLFIILPGHEIPEAEDIVERSEEYDIVQKHEGEPAELARELDDRS